MRAAPISMPLRILNYRILFVFFSDHVHCTLCEEKEDEPNSGVQRCKCSISKIMQNVSTLQEFTACCLSRLDGRYTMTFNWYLKKKELKCLLSATAIWQKKKTKKRCALIYVLAIVFSLLNMESLWLNTSWEGECCLIPMPSSDGKRKWRRGSQYS